MRHKKPTRAAARKRWLARKRYEAYGRERAALLGQFALEGYTVPMWVRHRTNAALRASLQQLAELDRLKRMLQANLMYGYGAPRPSALGVIHVGAR